MGKYVTKSPSCARKRSQIWSSEVGVRFKQMTCCLPTCKAARCLQPRAVRFIVIEGDKTQYLLEKWCALSHGKFSTWRYSGRCAHSSTRITWIIRKQSWEMEQLQVHPAWRENDFQFWKKLSKTSAVFTQQGDFLADPLDPSHSHPNTKWETINCLFCPQIWRIYDEGYWRCFGSSRWSLGALTVGVSFHLSLIYIAD